MIRPAIRALAPAAVLAACASDSAIEPPPEPEPDPDTLTITYVPEPGSLDDLHERIIAKRCSGQPGLCHNGQFEPNLSTPALTFAYVVNRPGIEKPDRLRAVPGDPARSLLVDKLRNRNNVATQMPLGAEPLAEDDIRAIEAWITGGALRSPTSPAAPRLNNPPKRPEIGLFDTTGRRLDGTGPVQLRRGATVVLRHSVADFETADAAIPFAAFALMLPSGNQVVLNPGAPDPQVGPSSFDPSGPPGKGDLLNFRRSFTIPDPLPVRRPDGTLTTEAALGATINVLAVYIDGATPGIVAIDSSPTPISIIQ